jgi:hypothetical protein
MKPEDIVIRVKHGADTNRAQVIAPRGVKAQASSSSSPESAAIRVAEKLYPDRVGGIRIEMFEWRPPADAPVIEISLWRITKILDWRSQ